MFLRPNISKHKYVCVESLGAFYVFILCKGNDKRTSFYDQQFYYEAQWYTHHCGFCSMFTIKLLWDGVTTKGGGGGGGML